MNVKVPGYEILQELGRGGMGVVYEARQEGLNRLVALKMILHGEHASSEDRARFQAEALAIAKLQHENIVQIYAVGTQDGLPYFALEFCAAGTLAQFFAAPQVAALLESLQAAAALVSTLARAVHAAHLAGVIHRDLKPGNVLLTKDGTPKITDFGLSKQTGDPRHQTQSGAIVGTPSYMSPEQATGKGRAVGPATDVYALGAILYEALTGRPPFTAATIWETLQNVCKQEPVPPRRLRPEVPGDLEAVVLQCLDKKPQARYSTAAALADDLDRWQSGDPVRAVRHGVTYRLGKWLRRHRRLVVAAAVAVLLLFCFWVGLADHGYAVPGAAYVQKLLDRREASLFRPAPSEAQLRTAAAEQRHMLRRHLLDMAIKSDGWFTSPHDHGDAWTQMQGTVALFSTPDANREHYDKCVRVLDRVFEPNGMTEQFVAGLGWPHITDFNISGEAVAWSMMALAKTLSIPDLASPAERACLLARLDQVQTVLDNYRSHDKQSGLPNGGWNLFANQEDPADANVYVTLLVCQGLLELSHADLPWHQTATERDQLLDAALEWLLERFDGRGWSTPSTVEDQYNDGFSLQVFCALLRAEADGRIQLPERVVEQIPLLLAECGTLAPDHKSPVALFSAPFHNHFGKLVPHPQRLMRPIWYAWAVHCSASWLRRCERLGAAHDEIVRTRRVLDHLLRGIGPAVVQEAMKGYNYVAAETLIGLSAVDPP